MSYDFAVWHGPAPLSNAHATSEYQRLGALGPQTAPTPEITRFVQALLSIYPDINAPGGEGSPWTDAPLINNANGTLCYFGCAYDRAVEVQKVVENAAADMNLVAFDPQRSELLPSAISVARHAEFDLPAPSELPLHLGAVIGEAMDSGITMAGIVEELSSSFYVQWMAQAGALTVEAQGEGLLPASMRLGNEGRSQMTALGFTEGEPNWTIHWADGYEALELAAQTLNDVLHAVRRFPAGAPMKLQTFPV